MISKLSIHPSPSGFEQQAAKRIKSVMSAFFDETEIDAFGNVYGIRKCGKKNAKCLLLDAHIDEIGLIVTGEKDGFLTFAPLGGVDPRILPAREVTVLTEPPRTGVITVAPPHLLSAAEMEKALQYDELYIDIGEESESGVEVGTPVVFDSEPVKLRDGYISGRALDDRASLAAILKAVDMLKGKKIGLDIVVLASVQEELGCRGATVAGYKIDPDLAVVVDVTHGTTPGADKSSTFDCGSGAAIGVGPNISKKLSNILLDIAKDKKIPHSIEVCAGETGTNAWELQVVREGIACALLSIPLKYMHTPVETVKKNDIEAVAKLICEFVLSISSGGGKL